MSFWSTLGKIGSVVAAPFTGGASLAGLGIIDALGKVGAGSSKGAADGRLLESQDQLRRDDLAQRGAVANTANDSARMRQAILMSLMGGMEDAKVGLPAGSTARVPTISGGLRPSALKGGGADIAAAMRPRIMQALMQGGEIPMPMGAPSPSGFDKFNNVLGNVGAYAGAVAPFIKPKPTTPPYVPGTITGTMTPGVTFRRS